MPRVRLVGNAVFGLKGVLGDPRLAVIAGLTATEIGGATVFYRLVEGWRWVDAFYFSVVTIATVGFGDLAPRTDVGKLFTVFYILTGIGLFVTFAAALADHMIRNAHRERTDRDTPEE
ncbi:potassium channel family protein [Cereibacter sphaeroides]|uniref:potassium channel family protein n=1 Tax=Cereibacter sphaeroides TaxID=1063 RepID=UPI001F2942FB|nr:potassium channel family protein [Cereibacter sphaeroides]MCE6960683.1 potassium channel family protein [Cereibacter sphaeroides]MCE6973215.1 potassium channel family protein [Cereibacter sphaeroides]